MAAGAVAAAGVAISTGTARAVTGQQLLNDAFTGATSTAPVVALNNNTPGFPCLTAGTNTAATPIAGCNLARPDAAGSGALRFTDANMSEASGVLYNTSLPTSEGLTITFDRYQYGGGGPIGIPADGISFDLTVAPPSPATIGPPGGSLGYAGSVGNGNGLPGGWLGIGFDVFGNYTNPAFDGNGCTDPAWAGFNSNQVTARGPGNGLTGFCLLSSSASVGNGLSDMGIQLQGALGTRADALRAVQIIIDPHVDLRTVHTMSG